MQLLVLLTMDNKKPFRGEWHRPCTYDALYRYKMVQVIDQSWLYLPFKPRWQQQNIMNSNYAIIVVLTMDNKKPFRVQWHRPCKYDALYNKGISSSRSYIKAYLYIHVYIYRLNLAANNKIWWPVIMQLLCNWRWTLRVHFFLTQTIETTTRVRVESIFF